MRVISSHSLYNIFACVNSNVSCRCLWLRHVTSRDVTWRHPPARRAAHSHLAAPCLLLLSLWSDAPYFSRVSSSNCAQIRCRNVPNVEPNDRLDTWITMPYVKMIIFVSRSWNAASRIYCVVSSEVLTRVFVRIKRVVHASSE